MSKRVSKLFMMLAVVAVTVVMTGCCSMNKYPFKKTSKINYDNAYFYDKDGKFLEERAKDAVISLMKYHGYNVFPGLREKLWVSDYGTGRYTELGLAAYMYKNNEKDQYMLMDLFLMPNQMLPEHWHLPTTKNPVKMEGWLVRNGKSHIVGEGTPNLSESITIPSCHMNGKVTVEHEVIATPGVFVPLNRATARHWQYGGPEGAIITEVANVHDNDGVRHSDKKINDFFLK